MIKYQNVLECEKDFKEMLEASEKIANNCKQIQKSHQMVDNHYMAEICKILHQQEAPMPGVQAKIEDEMEKILVSLKSEKDKELV